MAVQVWIGEKPEHPNERRAIIALANGLDRLEGLYVLLVNFHVGGRTVDLTIIKQDAIFIIELKHCHGKILGDVNGEWYLENANGERKHLNPGRSNPYNQVISCYYSLTNFLNDHRADFLSPHKAQGINFRASRRLVVIAPFVHEGSQVELDWKVDLKGLDELPSFLVTERTPEIELTEEEMLAIPRMLHCTRWHDVNTLLEGVLPAWDVDTDTTAASAPAAPPPRAPLAERGRQSLQTTPGRLAALLGLLVVLLLVVLLRPLPHATPQAALPSLVSATWGPAGGVVGNEPLPAHTTCVWSEFQPVGKRWDEAAQGWISVGVDGITTDLYPEVVVTLEKVDYCGEEIVFTWSVRNNSDDAVRFSLRNRNITIRDPLGNSYMLDETRSRPLVVRVAPGAQEQGTMAVAGPVAQHVPSLLVRLKEEPFGEASWLVSLEAR